MIQHLKPLIISTAMVLVLISLDKVSADSTHFTEKAEPVANQTPVEAKAAEFQKVLQTVEGQNTAKAEPQMAPHEAEISQNTPHEEAELAVIEAQPIAQLPAPEASQEAAPVEAVVAAITPNEAIDLNPTAKPEITAENKELPKLEPKVEEESTLLVAKEPTLEIADYGTIQNGRSPLGILESNRDLPTQKWYLFSSAKRGTKSPNDIVEIVSIVNEANPKHRGEEVKALLVEMGIKPENINVVAAKGDEGQIGKIYIFKK